MQGTRSANATGLPKRRRPKKIDSIALASMILASAADAATTEPVAFRDTLKARKVLGDAVERLLGILDTIEGDPDLEETGDLEPSIGVCHRGEVDIEADTGDDEPSLGSFDRMVNQEKSYRQTSGWNRGEDCEQDDCDREDGGDTELNGDEADDDELELDEGRSGIGDMDGLIEQTGFPVTNWAHRSSMLQITEGDAEAAREASRALGKIVSRVRQAPVGNLRPMRP